MKLYFTIKEVFLYKVICLSLVPDKPPFIFETRMHEGYDVRRKELKGFLTTNFIWVFGVSTLDVPAKILVSIDSRACSWFRVVEKNNGSFVLEGSSVDLFRKPSRVLEKQFKTGS